MINAKRKRNFVLDKVVVFGYNGQVFLFAQIAQSVEQWTENPRVTGSIPVLGIFLYHYSSANGIFFLFLAQKADEKSYYYYFKKEGASALFFSYFKFSTTESRCSMKRWDIILIAITLLAAAGIYFFYMGNAKEGGTAVITVDGDVFDTLPLDEHTKLRVETPWGYNVVTVTDGSVSVTDADCRDSICVNHKKITKTGETIVCLPHKMVVEIEGGDESETDLVVG